MVWTLFKNQQRENPKESFEHEHKMLKRETEIKMETTG
jgi:hypothetical protein